MKAFDLALGLLVILYVLDWQIWFTQDTPEAARCQCGDISAEEYDRLHVFEDFMNSLPE